MSDMKQKHEKLLILYEGSESGTADQEEIDIGLKELKKAQDALKKCMMRRKCDMNKSLPAAA